jgi:hypothetical protein
MITAAMHLACSSAIPAASKARDARLVPFEVGAAPALLWIARTITLAMRSAFCR